MEWEHLAILLSFTSADIEHIKMDYPRETKHQIVRMLTFWIQRNGRSTGIDLVKHLREQLCTIGRRDVADAIQTEWPGL